MRGGVWPETLENKGLLQVCNSESVQKVCAWKWFNTLQCVDRKGAGVAEGRFTTLQCIDFGDGFERGELCQMGGSSCYFSQHCLHVTGDRKSVV